MLPASLFYRVVRLDVVRLTIGIRFELSNLALGLATDFLSFALELLLAVASQPTSGVPQSTLGFLPHSLQLVLKPFVTKIFRHHPLTKGPLHVVATRMP